MYVALKALREDFYRSGYRKDKQMKIKDGRKEKEEAHVSNRGDKDISMKADLLLTQCFPYLRRNK